MTARFLTLDEVKDRFWQKVDRTEDCWIWTGAVFTNGYGAFSWWKKVKKSHRVAWEWDNGAVPEGFTLDHLCRVRLCVRPDHMEVVTPAENSRRGSYHKTGATHERCRYGHARRPGETRGCPTCQERIRERDRTRLRFRKKPRANATQRALARQLAQIGDMLFHPERHGFSSRDEAITYLWPTEPGQVAA